MDTNKFYSDKYRLKHNPSNNLKKRSGLGKFDLYDDRFDEIVKELSNIIDNHEGKVNMLDIGLGSFLIQRFNFPYNIITPRLVQIIGNRYLKSLALGHLLVLQK